MEAQDLGGNKQFWLNVVCWDTSYQQVERLIGNNAKTAENTYHILVDAWIRIFGHPEVLVMNPGLEFERQFSDLCQAHPFVCGT